MARPGEPLPLTPDEIRRIRRQIDELLTGIQTRCAGGDAAVVAMQQRINELLKEMGGRAEDDWKKAQRAVNTLVRMQTAQGLAARFMEHVQPYKSHAELTAMMEEGLLHHATFIQKPPSHLRFYKALLAAIEPAPRCVLEIGVKGGGSTSFWKALFPAATVIGLDLKLRWLQPGPSEDGVIYLHGDQTDVARLREIADEYGPFDLVIDDGSHVSAHQATTIRGLLPHVRPGGFYVIEDIHASVKESSTRPVDYGDDIWADFTVGVLQRLRRGPAPPASDGAQLARELAPRITELIVARQILAIRVKDRAEEA
jgi:cephalosporin hydroxylase